MIRMYSCSQDYNVRGAKRSFHVCFVKRENYATTTNHGASNGRSVSLMFVHALKIIFLLVTTFNADGVDCSAYSAPDDCEWSPLNSNDVSVKCRLETIISSGVLATNFSLLQADQTTILSLECEPLFFESTLSPSSFYHLRFLKSLNIERCKLREIPGDAFFGLEQLRNLTVRTHNNEWGSFALALGSRSFSDLRTLENLDLGYNMIDRLTRRVLCDLSSLKTLNLTQNNLIQLFSDDENTALTDGHCMTDLVALDLSNNRIANLQSDSLKGFIKLRVLILRNNFIATLENNEFRNFHKLQVLDVSHNQLHSVSPTLLRDASDLRKLYLQNNSLMGIPYGFLSGLPQLVVLKLSYNHITSDSVAPDAFVDLIRLVILGLDHNRLNLLNGSIFQSQYSLQMLYLSHNMISGVADNTFSSLYNLHTLDLSYNVLEYVSEYTLNGLYVMNSLFLSHNNIHGIHPDAFRNCSSIQELDLRDNTLGNVPVALSSLQFLKRLSIANNGLTNHITFNSSFEDFQQLADLDLSDNRIGNLSKGSFWAMNSLQTLILSNNEIYKIEHGAFDALQALMEIDLSFNSLSDINGLFMNLGGLKVLNVSSNKVSWFDFALIPTGLRSLDLHGNEIDVLGNYYELESNLQLTILDASHNRIKELNAASLPNLVTVLNLSCNYIGAISPFTFVAKTNLSVVNVTNNRIKSLDINAFRLNSQVLRKPLPEFYVAGNPYFCDCNMEWLQLMNRLDGATLYPRVVDIDEVTCHLSFTRHRSVIPLVKSKPSDFLCSYRSHCFALCSCCEFDACDCEMVCPDNCTCYSDQTWNTNIVDCARREFRSVPSVIPMDVTELYLDGNDIRQLTSHTFIGRKNMKIALLNNSNIHVINNRTFNGLLSLRVLHLEGNELTALHGYEFETLVLLKELYLSHNKIRTISNATFQNLRSLQILYLDHNMINEFQLVNWNWNHRLFEVSLGDNPYSCECSHLVSFVQWLQSASAVVIDAESITCSRDNVTVTVGPSGQRFHLCSNFSDVTHFQAVLTTDNMLVTIVVASVGLLSLLALILVFIFRRHLNLWYHRKFGARRFVADSEKLFDAFVSYSKKDENFVSQLLAPELECGAPSYRLCLRYRDLPLSAYLADAITEAIECSHRTIIVLSEQFLRSDWCRFELKSSYRESRHNGNHKLVVVALDKLSVKRIDSDARMCLKNAPIFRWGDKRFWEKIRNSMPTSQKHNTASVDPKISRQRITILRRNARQAVQQIPLPFAV